MNLPRPCGQCLVSIDAHPPTGPQFKATVTVPDSDGPERILTIGANLGTACEILLEIIPQLEDNVQASKFETHHNKYQKYKDMDFESELRMLIHQSQAGCIIGRAGFKIKELREETGAQIKVYSQCAPESTERIVSIQGKPHTVVNCVATIVELLQTAPPKGFNNPYDPHNFDEYYAQEYGGFTSLESGGMGMGGRSGRGMGGGRGSSRGMGRGGRGSRAGMGDYGGMGSRGGRGGMGGGMGGSLGGGLGGMGGGLGGGMGVSGMRGRGGRGGRSGDGGFRNMDNFGGGSGGRSMGGSGGMNSLASLGGGMGGGMGGSQGGMGGGMNDNFASDSMLAGAIIGKGGSRIRQIRQESGAGITIDEAQPGSNDRIITITGNQDQIQNAQYLLQMSVKQYSGRY
ncbi:hypothetical protein LSH36_1051g00016 [Paralvinella palmiformis]|uniref:K Homology domain-containing protein n=1 Tax=Paralvinella palmiformis TaxID=53620 RepID=A0AAD9MS16_9ANNE|nr:hypothetical protein LSH36_1051g00016 [Paralvinella palmiformis]